jgi:hypothetical protein
MLHDVRSAIPALGASPAFTMAAILTLPLGIGANTAIFTAVYGVLLKPLPYERPDRVVRMSEGRPGFTLNVSYPNLCAAWVPARRASGIDPLTALKSS